MKNEYSNVKSTRKKEVKKYGKKVNKRERLFWNNLLTFFFNYSKIMVNIFFSYSKIIVFTD